jgi:hypothetical protein
MKRFIALVLIYLHLVTPLCAGAATITRYVDADAAAGGDGITNALTGANCAYVSWNSWEAAQQQDLTDNGGDIAECILESSHANHTADTTAVDISGWTTGPASYIDAKTSAAARHAGVWNTAKYRLSVTAAASSLTISEDYVRLDGLQIYNDHSAATSIGISIPNYTITATNNDIQIKNSIATVLNTGASRNAHAVYLADADAKATLINNIFISKAGDGNTFGVRTTSGQGATVILNNTVYIGRGSAGNSYGFNFGSASAAGTMRNNLIYATNLLTSSAIVNHIDDSNYNAYNGTDADMTGANDQQSRTFTFLDSDISDGTLDLHLASNDTGAMNLGVDLSATFTTDIDGTTRPTGAGTWDIGADEYVVAATGQPSRKRMGGIPWGTTGVHIW